jgi:hypothetical protein
MKTQPNPKIYLFTQLGTNKKTPCIRYRTKDGKDLYHPISSSPLCCGEYEIEMEDETWKRGEDKMSTKSSVLHIIIDVAIQNHR